MRCARAIAILLSVALLAACSGRQPVPPYRPEHSDGHQAEGRQGGIEGQGHLRRNGSASDQPRRVGLRFCHCGRPSVMPSCPPFGCAT